MFNADAVQIVDSLTSARVPRNCGKWSLRMRYSCGPSTQGFIVSRCNEDTFVFAADIEESLSVMGLRVL